MYSLWVTFVEASDMVDSVGDYGGEVGSGLDRYCECKACRCFDKCYQVLLVVLRLWMNRPHSVAAYDGTGCWFFLLRGGVGVAIICRRRMRCMS